MGPILCIAGPILPASIRISPASMVVPVLVEAAIGGEAGTHLITSADIATTAARGRH